MLLKVTPASSLLTTQAWWELCFALSLVFHWGKKKSSCLLRKTHKRFFIYLPYFPALMYVL